MSTFDVILIIAVVVLLGLWISQRSRARRGGPDTSSDIAHGHGHGHGGGHGFDGHGNGAMGGMVEATRAPQGHGDARAIVGRAANRSRMKREAVLGPRTRQNRRHR